MDWRFDLEQLPGRTLANGSFLQPGDLLLLLYFPLTVLFSGVHWVLKLRLDLDSAGR